MERLLESECREKTVTFANLSWDGHISNSAFLTLYLCREPPRIPIRSHNFYQVVSKNVKGSLSQRDSQQWGSMLLVSLVSATYQGPGQFFCLSLGFLILQIKA